MIIPIFSPHGGCPERCKFCDQSVSGGTPVSKTQIAGTIEKYLATSNTNEAEIAFYGGTFTTMPKRVQLEMLESVKPYIESGKIESIRLATRPDAISEEWISELKKNYPISIVELGVQSFSAEVLKKLGRSHTNTHVEEATKLLKYYGIEVGYHLMIGCPGENQGHEELTIGYLEALRPQFLRLHPLLIFENTEIAQDYKQNLFSLADHDQILTRSAYLIENTEKIGIVTLRLGLQDNDLIGPKVIGGFHDPGYGSAVRSRIIRNQLEKQLFELSYGNNLANSEITLQVSEKTASILPGKNHCNLHWLKSKFGLRKIKIEQTTKRLNKNEVEIWISNPNRTA